MRDISAQVLNTLRKQNIVAFIVDEENHLISTSVGQIDKFKQNMSDYAPILQYRKNQLRNLIYKDSSGQTWNSLIYKLDTGLLTIVQVPSPEYTISYLELKKDAGGILLVGSLVLVLLTWVIIQNSLKPIKTLTNTANEIASGNLSLIAHIDSQDEIGELAKSFNNVTAQLRDLITSLERKVNERTIELERRAMQLQVTADIAKEASVFRELDELIAHAVYLISDRFGFYHAGIFLSDDRHEYTELKAASSEGGQIMLARNHRLRIGRQGIVGYVASHGVPRIALDVGEDAVFFNNPDLPKTRSEMALPLRIREKTIGVLDVQSVNPAAFNNDDISTLQILADMIALAIDNSQLLSESQKALSALEQQYSSHVKSAWSLLKKRETIYTYTPQMDSNVIYSKEDETSDQKHVLSVRILSRGVDLGKITLIRAIDEPPWSKVEKEILDKIGNQFGFILENARLMDANRQKGKDEQMFAEITANLQSSLEVNDLLRKAVENIGRAFGNTKIRINIEGREI